ncbi:hypothetical protein KP509_09G041500 [Ceratopteris richardii]|nr:hypothetical protein KP509_09G041500 [Ceratopteris richardii]
MNGEADDSEEFLETLQVDFSSSGKQHSLTCLRLLESPPKLCIEQERRLRCANMEGPSCITDLTSDEDDDEGDGFEFAKVEKTTIESFNSDQGNFWSPITSFYSGHSSVKTPSVAAALDRPHSLHRKSLATNILLSEQLDSSDLAPELQCFISPDYTDLPLPESDSQSLLSSPISVSSPSQLFFCLSSSEWLASNSMDRVNSISLASEGSIYFPGFVSSTPLEHASFSPSSASFSESCVEYSPAFSGSCVEYSPRSDLLVDINTLLHHSPSSSFLRSNDSGTIQNLLDDHHCYSDMQGSRWDHPSPSPAKSLHVYTDTTYSEVLIPGLPNDLAQLCLMRVPFVKYDQSLRMVCKQWRAVLTSDDFYKTRSALGIHEAHLSFVVYGNRVQIFSLLSHQWFCLPPLPRDVGNISPVSGISAEWSYSPYSQSSPCHSIPDWGIDPYDWWQIDTVTVWDGIIFVIGGDKAEINSFTRPSRPSNKVHKYDFCQSRWVAVASMQIPRSHAAAVSSGNFLYVAGGSEHIEEGASAEVYDCQQNMWSMISNMNVSMRTCIGVEHDGCVYVKGENLGPGCHVEGEVFKPTDGKWDRMSPGMRKGLERGPLASCGSFLFVADWKDSMLKMYDCCTDSWAELTSLPARISRLVGHALQLYAVTGKIKVDSYNHHVISDAPAEVWMLDLSKIMKSLLEQQAEVASDKLRVCYHDGIPPSFCRESEWICLWRDSKQMAKTGSLAWVPCIAHCMIFED